MVSGSQAVAGEDTDHGLRILAGDIDKTKPVLVDVFDNVVVFRNEK